MATRRQIFLVAVAFVLCAYPIAAATQHTTNFTVEAPTPELARQFGEAAEHFRKLKAQEWLGEEMPNWQHPCPLRVTISMEGPSGATTFDFSTRPITQFMQITGPKERLLNSVLPHEITHTVFAYYFKQPVPRWADEGGSVLSEDDLERARHDQMCRQLLNAGRAMRLGYLFSLKEYPSDVMVLYAQGFSISRFLVEAGDRQTFLQFVKMGMSGHWDQAAQQFYHFNSVNEIETAWIDGLKKSRTSAIVSSQPKPTVARGVQTELTNRTVVRTTNPPGVPNLGSPAFRPTSNDVPSNGRPTRLPDAVMDPNRKAAPPPPLPPLLDQSYEPVRLGMPQLGSIGK
jgi:hypothetical protein